jgi:hypothetical protein
MAPHATLTAATVVSPDQERVMSQVRFGELLGRLVTLSRHDVEEILHEQGGTRRRFGDIALAWGLCEPEHVWQAWCDQLASSTQTADLDTLGIDSQAAALIDREVAARLGAIPIRCMGDTIVIAVADPDASQRVQAELQLTLPMKMCFVHADPHQVQRAIANYYPTEPAAA